jgi:hypothetical protein
MAIEDLEIAANLLNHQGKPQAAIEVRRLIDQLQTTVANVSYV